MLSTNLFDYLKKYRATTLIQEPINELDILIFSRISYFPLELLKQNFNTTLLDLFQRIDKADIKKQDFFLPDDYKLFKALLKAPRYHNLRLSNFKTVLDLEKEIQFGALLIGHADKNYVVYRGTDDNLVGWKEDFNMAFSEVVPSQELARKYLRKIYLFHPFRKIITIGHSKGGNLAVYASFKANFLIKRKIEKVYNIDGPGFLKNIQKSKKYQQISDKIINLAPQTSIVGRLLNYDDNLKIVKSDGVSLLQHDIYLWQTKDKNLIYLDKTSAFGDKINQILIKWLNDLSLEERKKGIEIIYDIIISSDVKSLKGLIAKFPSKLGQMLKNYQDLPKEDKLFIDLLNKKFKQALMAKENDK